MNSLRLAVLVSAALFALRLHVARVTGYGDAEALYASYALFPQPAYLDHPGLIGALARWIGGGVAPEPAVAHTITAAAATIVPWLGGLAARAAGVDWPRAARTVLALALVPEISIGLFGLTPDLPLAAAWLLALACALAALDAEPTSRRALWASLGTGAFVGLATLAKASGPLLGLALLAASFIGPARRRWATAGPWLAVALAAILVAPVLAFELRRGFPLLEHRLVATQQASGFSLRNLGALLGGQLAYVTPPFLWAAVVLGRSLARQASADPVSKLLSLCVLVPGVPLVVLCLWSRVAEPHWLAPAYLPLAIQASRVNVVGRRLATACFVTGAIVTLFAWLWIVTPLAPKLLGDLYRPRYDLANDLYAWGPGGRLLDDTLGRAMLETGRMPMVVGPHWIVCAQAQAHLDHRVRVGCNGPLRDDFDDWLPRQRWLDAPVLLYVHDSRFDVDPARELPGRRVVEKSRVDVRRADRVVRTIWVTRLDRDDATASLASDLQAGAGAWGERPAARIRSSSASGPGFGVVSSRSP